MTPPKTEQSNASKQGSSSTATPAMKNLEIVKQILEKARKTNMSS